MDKRTPCCSKVNSVAFKSIFSKLHFKLPFNVFMTHPDTFVQLTHKGVGLFAGRSFKRGEILWLIDDFDVKIPISQYTALSGPLREKLDVYTYMDFNHRVIVPWDDGKYVNHSCDPNATGLLQFDNLTIALCDIEQGEEIVENYNSYFAHFETFDCACGTFHCEGKITSAEAYRPELRIDLNKIKNLILSMDQYLLKFRTNENSDFLDLLGLTEIV